MQCSLLLALSSLVCALSVGVSAQLAGAYVTYDQLQGRPYNVTYDERSFIVNGQVRLFEYHHCVLCCGPTRDGHGTPRRSLSVYICKLWLSMSSLLFKF